jgi:uncharacterized protein (DUF2336 family)
MAEIRMDAQTNIIHDLESALGQGSQEQIALFDDVIGRLAAQIEVVARAELSARLAPIAHAPPKVIEALALDENIAVAGPVLTQSPCLSDALLVDISRLASHRHLLAISRRKVICEAVTDVLLRRGDRDILFNIASNPNAELSRAGCAALVGRCEGDDELTGCVGMRSDLPRHLFLQLLAKASATVRARLEQSHLHSSKEVWQVVAQIESRISTRTVALSRDYRQACTRIEALHNAGQLGATDVESFAAAGKFEEVAVALATLCDVAVEIVERAMVQERPEMALILARAAGLSWPVVKSILLLCRDGSISVRELDQCLINYQRLKQSTAEQAIRLPKFGQQVGR